jgi:hypothetical protein
MEPRLASLLLPSRSGVAEHEEAGGRGCFLPRHPARTWSPESSQLQPLRMETLHRRGEGERRHRARHAGIVIAQVGRCGVHGLMALRFSVSPLTGLLLRPLGPRAVMMAV